MLKNIYDLNTELRENAKNDSETDFFKLMNDSIFGKTVENTDIKCAAAEKKRNNLVSESNHHTKKWFSRFLLGIKVKKSSHE